MPIDLVKMDGSQKLQAELELLRTQLNLETENALKMRKAYETECRRLARGDSANVLATKRQLDLATSRLEGIQAEIAEKGRVLDEAQGRDAKEARRLLALKEFELACDRVAEFQAELSKLRAEHIALPEKIHAAEWRFNQALRNLNEAKTRVASQDE